MSHFVFILLIEVILVLSILLIVFSVFNWKKKKQNASEIEHLLGQIEENDATRKNHLVNYLMGQLSMEEQSAVEQVEDFIAAEKRFAQQFLEIQLNQQPVSSFYQHSCEFVDKYLQLIAENIPKAINNDLDISGEVPLEEQRDANNSEEIEEKNEKSDVKDVEPEIIDSNSESLNSNEVAQTSSLETEPKEDANNTEAEEDEFSEEPDWGDAFAEAGVEVDENSGKEL